MTRSTSTQNQIQELKRKISVIEWDLPNLKNKGLKYHRGKELDSAKNILSKLLNDDPSKDDGVE